jgi:malonate transporter and related proteins
VSVLTIVAPVFAVIALGYLAARTGFLSEMVHKGLAEFAFRMAIPALMFRTVATATPGTTEAFPLWLTYFGSVAIVWVIATWLTRFMLQRPATDAPAIAMASTYGNTVMIGIPILFAMWGDRAATPIALILSLTSPIMWSTASVHQAAVDGGEQTTIGATLRSAFEDLAKNPLILAILTAGLWRLFGWSIPTAVDKTLALIGQAGIPCALIGLGASLTQFKIKGQAPTLSMILVLKLLIFPVVTFLVGRYLARLDAVALSVAVLFAATPSGANAFLFANRAGHVVNSSSGAVALGTALSVITISLLVTVSR